jgi:hypothetical protein
VFLKAVFFSPGESRKKELTACRGEGSAAGPLLAARALPLRCAVSAVLTIYTGYA